MFRCLGIASAKTVYDGWHCFHDVSHYNIREIAAKMEKCLEPEDGQNQST